MAHPDFDSIAATTLKNYRKTLTDNIFDHHPVLYWLKDKKRVRFESGGETIVEEIIHLEGDTPDVDPDGMGYDTGDGGYGEWDAIQIVPVETATAAQYDWKQVAATIAISGLQELKNAGPERLSNLLDAKILQAEETLKNNLSTMLFNTTVGGNAINSLPHLIGDGTTGGVTVGGIDSSAMANDFWRSTCTDLSGVAAADLDLRARIRTAYNTASKGSPTNAVDMVVSAQGAYEQYEEDLLPTVRRQHKAMADAGFQSLEVQGVPWVWDWNCNANEIYGIASKFLGMVGHKNRWFVPSKFTDGLTAAVAGGGGNASVVDARYSVITAALQLTTRNRRRHFRLSGFTLR